MSERTENWGARAKLPELEPLLRLREVGEITRLGKSTIYRYIRNDQFPKPLQLSGGAVRWTRASITGWLRRLEQAAGADQEEPLGVTPPGRPNPRSQGPRPRG